MLLLRGGDTLTPRAWERLERVFRTDDPPTSSRPPGASRSSSDACWPPTSSRPGLAGADADGLLRPDREHARGHEALRHRRDLGGTPSRSSSSPAQPPRRSKRATPASRTSNAPAADSATRRTTGRISCSPAPQERSKVNTAQQGHSPRTAKSHQTRADSHANRDTEHEPVTVRTGSAETQHGPGSHCRRKVTSPPAQNTHRRGESRGTAAMLYATHTIMHHHPRPRKRCLLPQ